MRLHLLILLTVNLILAPRLLGAEPPHVVFINPGHQSVNPTGAFWSKVSLFTEAAANDLNIKLTTFYAQRDHFYMRSLVKKAIKLKPDFLILVNEKSVGPSLLKLLANADVRVFFLLNDLSSEQYQALSSDARAKVIGGVQPNNYRAGFIQAKRLLESKSRGPNHKYQILALLGDHQTPAAIDRQNGLLDALKASKVKHELIGSAVANWSFELGFTNVSAYLKRDQPIDLIWSANDAIAYGAMKAVRSYEQSILVGGVNWDQPPESYELYISMGGHVTLGALGVVYLHDLFNGLVQPNKHWTAQIFAESGSNSSKAFNDLLYQNQVDAIDFTRFSIKSPEAMSFTIENLVKGIE